MFLPIGDEPNPRGVPWANYALLAANVAVFLFVSLPLMHRSPDVNDPLVQQYIRELLRRNPGLDLQLAMQALRGVSAYDLLLAQWGYTPADPSPLTLLTSMFLHGGWLHLLGNMLFLWIFGDNVEDRLGSIGYLACYLATGAAAALGFGALVPDASAHVPMVGASGAISGVLGFYFIWFPHNRVRVFVMLFPLFVDVWRVQARIVLGFYLVIDNLLPFFVRGAGGGGVAYGAHIGGFVAGLLLAIALERWLAYRCRKSAAGCGDTYRRSARSNAAADVIAASDRGDVVGAVQTYFGLPADERRQVPIGVISELADWLSGDGQPDAALGLYRQALADHPRGPGLDRVFLGIGLVLLHGKK